MVKAPLLYQGACGRPLPKWKKVEARFPFSVRGGERSYSIHDFSASSDNPNFDPSWVHIVKATDGMGSSRYILEIRPANIGRRQYGTCPISIRRAAPGVVPLGADRSVPSG
jgi:hypothetical protein